MLQDQSVKCVNLARRIVDREENIQRAIMDAYVWSHTAYYHSAVVLSVLLLIVSFGLLLALRSAHAGSLSSCRDSSSGSLHVATAFSREWARSWS